MTPSAMFAPSEVHLFRNALESRHACISTGLVLRHSGQRLMSRAVANARVEPKGNAIIITEQASGSAKIDPMMAASDIVRAKPHSRRILALRMTAPHFSCSAVRNAARCS